VTEIDGSDGPMADIKLVEWLADAITEREDAARERSTAVHIALHDPESALRQCAAARKILGRYERLADRDQKSFAMCVKLDALEEVLRDIAKGYGYEEGP
jgi:hypothetical protein